jgi:hypothetical protein
LIKSSQKNNILESDKKVLKKTALFPGTEVTAKRNIPDFPGIQLPNSGI